MGSHSRIQAAIRWSLTACAGTVFLLGACSFVWRIGYWAHPLTVKLYPGRVEFVAVQLSLRPGAAPADLAYARAERYRGWQSNFSLVWRGIPSTPSRRNGLVWPHHWSLQMPHLQLSVMMSFSVLSVPLWMPLVATAVPAIWLWRRDRRVKPGHCEACGYDLTGNTSGACPECGGAI